MGQGIHYRECEACRANTIKRAMGHTIVCGCAVVQSAPVEQQDTEENQGLGWGVRQYKG